MEYDPDAMYLKIVLWKQEGLSLAEKAAAGRKVAVNKFAKVQNLMEKIEKLTGFSSSRVAVIRKTTNYYSASSEVLSKSGNMQKSLSELRLFDSAVLYRFGRVLRDSQRLKDLQFFEQSKLCIQRFAEAVPELGVKDTVVSCRRWRPSTLQLEAPIHIILNKGGTQFDLGKQLESIFTIPVEKIEVYKVGDLLNFSRAKLSGIGWVGLGNKREKVEQYPVCLTSDGYLLIVKDKSEVKSEVAQDMKNGKPTEKTNFRRKPGMEKSIIITVKGETDERNSSQT
jgi:hypothetical protein